MWICERCDKLSMWNLSAKVLSSLATVATRLLSHSAETRVQAARSQPSMSKLASSQSQSQVPSSKSQELGERLNSSTPCYIIYKPNYP